MTTLQFDNIQIHSSRFYCRRLTTKDATIKYLSWLENENSATYIATAKQTNTLSDIREYILEKNKADDTLFLAIISNEDHEHIGNIKYDNINYSTKSAIMGILIGEERFRGKGVAQEIIEATAKWLKENLQILNIFLAVNRMNLPAIKAYEKIGFLTVTTDEFKVQSKDAIPMVWRV
ncbi:MAG: GNAT family protein [Leptospira sp.]|nr:GNAT family protein [Leptospira sp.]